MPDGGPAPPLRDVPYGVTTRRKHAKAVQELAARKVDHYVKVWLDDRGGDGEEAAAGGCRGCDRRGPQARAPHHHALLEMDDVKAIMRAGIDGFGTPRGADGRSMTS